MTNNQVATTNGNKKISLAGCLNNNTVKRKFEEVLGKKANGFISSLLSLTNSTPALQQADPKTVLSAAMTAATLDLPINPNLGFAYIVPYRSKNGMQGQFQMGYKGFNQLAMRTGQYKTINVSAVYEGQIKSIDPFTGDIERGEKESDKIIGYVAYFKMINGFEKYLYMTVEELEAHGKKYSQAYRSGKDCLWKSNFDSMAKKTVLKLLISKYGIMSIEMLGMDKALQADQAVIGKNNTYDYVDNQDDDVIDADVVDVPSDDTVATTQTQENSEHMDDDAILDAVLGQMEEQK